jgi:hypothetical protein
MVQHQTQNLNTTVLLITTLFKNLRQMSVITISNKLCQLWKDTIGIQICIINTLAVYMFVAPIGMCFFVKNLSVVEIKMSYLYLVNNIPYLWSDISL